MSPVDLAGDPSGRDETSLPPNQPRLVHGDVEVHHHGGIVGAVPRHVEERQPDQVELHQLLPALLQFVQVVPVARLHRELPGDLVRRNVPVAAHHDLPDPGAHSGAHQNGDVRPVGGGVAHGPGSRCREGVAPIAKPARGAVGQRPLFILAEAAGVPLLSFHELVPLGGELRRKFESAAVAHESDRVEQQGRPLGDHIRHPNQIRLGVVACLATDVGLGEPGPRVVIAQPDHVALHLEWIEGMRTDRWHERQKSEDPPDPHHSALAAERDFLPDLFLRESVLPLEPELDRLHLSFRTDSAERVLSPKRGRHCRQQAQRDCRPINTHSGSAA